MLRASGMSRHILSHRFIDVSVELASVNNTFKNLSSFRGTFCFSL